MISVSKGIGTYVPENWRRGSGGSTCFLSRGGRPLNGVEIYLTEKGGLTPWRTP